MASASYGASHAHRVGYGDVGEDEDEGFMPAVLGSSLSSQRSGSYNMRLRSTSPADAELGLYASAGSGGGRRSTRNRDRISSEDSAASATRATYRATHSAGHAPRVRRARTASITSQSTRNTVDGDDDDGDGDEDEDDEDEDGPDKPCLCWGGPNGFEVRRIFVLAWPLALGYLSSSSMNTIQLAYIGHLGTEYLTAGTVAMVVMFGIYVAASSVLNSLSTLVSQAYGAGATHAVGMWLQTAMALGTFVIVPLTAVIWFFAGDIMSFFGTIHSDEMLALTNEFARWNLLSLWPLITFQAFTIWLESIEIIWPTTVVTIVFVLVAWGLNQLFIKGLFGWDGMGFIGSPIASSVSAAGQLFTIWLWVWVIQKVQKSTNTWPGFVCRAIQWRNIWQMLKLGLPMAATELVFDWMFEILTILAGRLGENEVAVQGVLSNILFLWQPIAMGVYISTSIRIGNKLGGGDPNAAKRTAMLGLGLATAVAVVVSVLLYIFRAYVGRIYSTSEDIVTSAATVAPWLALEYFLASLSYVMQGVLEGMARPGMATIAALVGNWAVGLTLAWVFGEKLGYGLTGLWWGVLIGEVAHFIILLGLVAMTDWHHEAERAVALAEEEDAEIEAAREAAERESMKSKLTQKLTLDGGSASLGGFDAEGDLKFGLQDERETVNSPLLDRRM